MTSPFLAIFIATTFVFLPPLSRADETIIEKAEATKNKVVNTAKETYKSANDKGCEIINGKKKCAPKKLRHKIENETDGVTAKTKELINKVD
mgnify:CR=1 FL=1